MNKLFRPSIRLLSAALLGALSLSNHSLASQYQPPSERLESRAGRSTELYVDPAFNFEMHKQVTLDLQAFNADGKPLANRFILIKGRSASANILEPEDYSLLAILRTDAAGAVYRSIEIGSDIAQLQIQLKAVGIENQHQVKLQQAGQLISHTFD